MIFPNNYPIQRLGITWQLSEFHGWGVFGLNIAKALIHNGQTPPKLLFPPKFDSASYPELTTIANEWNETTQQTQTQKITKHNDLTVIHSLGNDFALTNPNHWGIKNVGFIFFETTQFTPDGISRAQTFDLIIAGSRWNAALLKKIGIKNVAYVMQGIDPKRFQNISPVSNDKFIIFSGGKLEFRKGQDIVLAAYKQFHQKYPNSVLITNWSNPWPGISQDLKHSPYGFGIPNIKDNLLDINEWCLRSGLPKDAFFNCSFIPNAQMPKIYASADVGLFPNRAEGGTNLVAMECMAAGVPCIVSENTGHIDLIAQHNVIPLKKQTPINNPACADWGESSIDEIVNALEYAYHNREKLKEIGKIGQEFINQYSWSNQANNLMNILSSFY